MNMNEELILVLAGIAGALLGGVFFGGLWWTVRRGVPSPHPVRWFLGSLLVRTSLAMTGFYLVSSGDWQRLLSCLVGFALARPIVKWLTRSWEDRQARGISHAA
jgi:F1F0 ATPase subunit 2